MGLAAYMSRRFARKSSVASPADYSGDRAMRGSLTGDVDGIMRAYGDISPSFPIVFIDTLKVLALINPDISQTVHKIVELGNVGHAIDIKGSSDVVIGIAVDELNTFARNAFPNHAGADGFINQQFRQIILTGALCQEMAPTLSLDGIEDVYQVKAQTIRFRSDGGKYIPIQRAAGKEIILNPETFSYIPLLSDEDSPYAIPPFLAALRMAMRQEKQWNDIDAFMDLWGMMGISHLKKPLKKSFQETETEYLNRAGKELQKTFDLFKKNLKKGIVITDNETSLEHHNVAKNAGQVDTLIQATEQQFASGLDIDPAMLGRTYSTTETYATVCYETLLGKIANIRRIIKRGNERIYNTHLVMRQIPAVCSMTFNPSPSLKRYEEAQANQIKQQMILERMTKGIISPDMAAHELGYESAYSAEGMKEPLSKTFVFDRLKGKYCFSRPRVSIAELSKKKALTTKDLRMK